MNDISHPLDNADPDQCYSVMMSERTALITAKRESEDNLVKTVVQLSSAMIVVAAGFVSQGDMILSETAAVLFNVALMMLCLAIVAAVGEQRLSDKAYEHQIREVISFYTKEKTKPETPKLNWWVEQALNVSLSFFVAGLFIVVLFAVIQAME